MASQTVLVLDFGGQYNQLIARRVRECSVYCEVKPYTTSLEEIKALNPIGIIFTGGPNSVYDPASPQADPEIFKLGIPILGICYGCQLLAHNLGGRVVAATEDSAREYGKTETYFNTDCKLFRGLPAESITWMSHGDYMEKVPEGFEKLAQFEKLADPDDQIAQQFALRSRVLLGRLDGRYTPLEQIDLLMQAIQLTVPRFDLESIESFLYTRDEITIINQIGLAYSDAGQNKKAAEIYYQLLKYVRKHFKETITSIGVLPLVLYNYARVLDLCGRYEEGAALAKEGREACIQYGHYQVLPRCLEIEAECRHFMGDDEISKELYYQSYYLCKVIGYQIGLEVVKKEAKEYLNIDFMS